MYPRGQRSAKDAVYDRYKGGRGCHTNGRNAYQAPGPLSTKVRTTDFSPNLNGRRQYVDLTGQMRSGDSSHRRPIFNVPQYESPTPHPKTPTDHKGSGGNRLGTVAPLATDKSSRKAPRDLSGSEQQLLKRHQQQQQQQVEQQQRAADNVETWFQAMKEKHLFSEVDAERARLAAIARHLYMDRFEELTKEQEDYLEKAITEYGRCLKSDQPPPERVWDTFRWAAGQPQGHS